MCGFRQRFVGPQRSVSFPEEVVDEMVRLYVEEDLSLREVGRKVGAERSTVKSYLCSRGVKLRPPGGSSKRTHSAQQDEAETIDWLYHGLGYSQSEIAERLGLNSNASISRRMQKHGIPTRSDSDALRLRHRKHPRSEETRKKLSESAKRQWKKNGGFPKKKEPAEAGSPK